MDQICPFFQKILFSWILTLLSDSRHTEIAGINVFSLQASTNGYLFYHPNASFTDPGLIESYTVYAYTAYSNMICICSAGEYVDFTSVTPEIISSLLKSYIRELPQCLIPQLVMYKLEDALVMQDSQQRLKAFKKHFSHIPVPNTLMLSWLLLHLRNVIGHEKENKMSLHNIIIVFSPTLRISINLLVALYENLHSLAPNVELFQYKRPNLMEFKNELREYIYLML